MFALKLGIASISDQDQSAAQNTQGHHDQQSAALNTNRKQSVALNTNHQQSAVLNENHQQSAVLNENHQQSAVLNTNHQQSIALNTNHQQSQRAAPNTCPLKAAPNTHHDQQSAVLNTHQLIKVLHKISMISKMPLQKHTMIIKIMFQINTMIRGNSTFDFDENLNQMQSSSFFRPDNN